MKDSQHKSLSVLHWMPAILVLALFVWGLVWLNSPKVRYQNYPCHYEMIYGELPPTGAVDYLVLGNSRGQVAISAQELQNNLSTASEKKVVWDFSKSWRGPELLYQFATEVLATKKVHVVLLEFNVAKSPRVRYHEHTRFVLSFGSLLDVTLNETRDSWYFRGSQFMRWIAERATRISEDAIKRGLKKFNMSSNERGDGDAVDCNPPSRWINVKANLRRRNYYKKTPWQKRKGVWDITSINERLNLHFLRKTIDLARSRGAVPVLYYVPEYHTPPLTPEFVSKVSKFLGAPFISPGVEVYEKVQNPGWYHDPTHFTPQGSKFYSGWLSSEIKRVTEQSLNNDGDDKGRPGGR